MSTLRLKHKINLINIFPYFVPTKIKKQRHWLKIPFKKERTDANYNDIKIITRLNDSALETEARGSASNGEYVPIHLYPKIHFSNQPLEKRIVVVLIFIAIN